MSQDNEEISVKGIDLSEDRAFRLLRDAISRVSVICNGVGTTLIFCMMLLTTVDVVLRGVFNNPIAGAFEATGLLMLMVVALGLSYTQLKKGHISIELLTSRMSRRAQAIDDIFIYLICLGIYALISWQAIVGGQRQQIANVVISEIMKIPIYPFYYVLALGGIILCLVFMLDIIDAFHSLWGVKKR
jgi:TRAP-type C4-dicarboxylate transport system permease small subunit